MLWEWRCLGDKKTQRIDSVALGLDFLFCEQPLPLRIGLYTAFTVLATGVHQLLGLNHFNGTETGSSSKPSALLGLRAKHSRANFKLA